MISRFLHTVFLLRFCHRQLIFLDTFSLLCGELLIWESIYLCILIKFSKYPQNVQINQHFFLFESIDKAEYLWFSFDTSWTSPNFFQLRLHFFQIRFFLNILTQKPHSPSLLTMHGFHSVGLYLSRWTQGMVLIEWSITTIIDFFSTQANKYIDHFLTFTYYV